MQQLLTINYNRKPKLLLLGIILNLYTTALDALCSNKVNDYGLYKDYIVTQPKL